MYICHGALSPCKADGPPTSEILLGPAAGELVLLRGSAAVLSWLTSELLLNV